ncbi:MAG: hypothetical protein EP329_16610 [Deltaproteobacteria bacterium]|nr:MAG: hypothetical protein EP329_16610 [Deltaproteobacteria bacterium]
MARTTRWRFGTVAILMIAGCGSLPPHEPPVREPAIARRALEEGESARARRAVDLLAARPPGSFEAGWASARALLEAGRVRDAAAVFEAVATGWPGHEAADSAWYNAGFAWGEARDRDRSLNALQAVAHDYPASELAPKAASAAALLAEEGGRLEEAVARLELFVRDGARWQDWDAARRACHLAWVVGDAYVAVPACRLAARAPDGTPRWRLLAVEVLEGAGQLRQAERELSEVLRASRALPAVMGEALVASARIATARGQRAAAARARERIVTLWRQTREPGALQEAAAEILLSRADARAEAANAIPLAGDLSTLKRALERRAKAIREAASAYEAVFELKAPGPAARAATGTGRLYEAFCDAMVAARPVDDALYDTYRPALEELMQPIRERAIAAYEFALRVRGPSPAVAEAARALMRLRPDRYPVARVAALAPAVAEAPAGAEDEAAAREALWRDPDDLSAILAVAEVELSLGRERVARYYAQRAWDLSSIQRVATTEAFWLRQARLQRAFGLSLAERHALERGAEAAEPTGEAAILMGAEELAGLRYTEAAEVFAGALEIGVEPRCEARLGAVLAAVGVAEGDPARSPREGLERYLDRCSPPHPLALLWLARTRLSDGEREGALALCRRYLAAPSPEDPTDGRSWCEALTTL